MISLTPLILFLAKQPIDFDALWFRQVGGAAEYAQIRPESLPLPAAWVIRAGENVTHAGDRAEDTDFLFDVVIAIENQRDHQPGETDDILLQYRKAVKAKLLGWEMPSGDISAPTVKPIRFGGGRVLQYTEGDLYWADRYSFQALITNYLPDPPPYESTLYTGASSL